MTVFVSHHHSDHEVALHVARYLSLRNVNCWIAPENVRPGHDWDEEIPRAINDASALLLLFSQKADTSRHVKRELMLADRARIPIFLLRLEKIEPEKLGYLLITHQWIDWMDQRDATLESLVRALQGSVGSTEGAQGPLDAATALKATDGDDQSGTIRYQASRSSLSQHRGPNALDEPAREPWPRLVAVLPSATAAADATARLILQTAKESPGETLLLPTGRTATKVYTSLLRLAPEFAPDPFGDAFLMSDTETFGVYERHPTSRYNHVQSTLIEPLARQGLSPTPDHIRLLRGVILEEDPIQAANLTLRRYPPALHVIAVAPSGEVIGYEVATYTDPSQIVHDRCRVIELSQTGREYIDPDQPSRSVVTIGMGTCLTAGRLVIPIFDEDKASVISRMIRFEETPGIPSTLLRRHPRAVIVMSERVAEAADFGATTRFDSAEVAAEAILRALQ